MNLMLVVIFASVFVGLFAKRFARRQNAILVCLSVGMSVLYIVFPQRLM